jgi:hypothetical protein
MGSRAQSIVGSLLRKFAVDSRKVAPAPTLLRAVAASHFNLNVCRFFLSIESSRELESGKRWGCPIFYVAGNESWEKEFIAWRFVTLHSETGTGICSVAFMLILLKGVSRQVKGRVKVCARDELAIPVFPDASLGYRAECQGNFSGEEARRREAFSTCTQREGLSTG